MPIAGVEGGEGPGDGLVGQALRDVRIVVDVSVVVEVDEIVPSGLPKDQHDHQQQKSADGRRQTQVSTSGVVHDAVGVRDFSGVALCNWLSAVIP